MWILNKKRIIIIALVIFIGLLCIGLFATIKPTLTIKKNSIKTAILLDGEPISEGYESNEDQEIKIPISRGGHTLVFLEKGFLKEEINIRPKIFGNTEVFYQPKPSQPLLEDLPIIDTSQGGFIEITGFYNDFMEPTYNILGYEIEPKKGDELLKARGIDINKVRIEYIKDGD